MELAAMVIGFVLRYKGNEIHPIKVGGGHNKKAGLVTRFSDMFGDRIT